LKASSLNKQQFFLIWLINPFISAWLLFRKMKRVKAIGPYLLISFFFGFSFVLVPESGADSMRYANELKLLHEMPVALDTYFSQIYNEEGSKLDVYQPLLTWLVSQFTGNYQWLFGIYALVFGYFWFKSIRLARTLLPNRLNSFFVVLLLFFALINPIWSINGVRMWTAVGIFFYGILTIHFLDNKKGYLLLVLPLFIHFSLTIALVLYIAYRVLPTKNFRILYIVYTFTFFVGELNLDIIRNYFELLPGFVQSRQSYLNEEYVAGIKESREQLAIHITLYNTLLKYVIIVMISWIFFSFLNKKTVKFSKFTQFFTMTLIFSAFSNLANQIPSGGRFIVLSNLMVVFSFIWYLSDKIKGNIPAVLQKMSVVVLFFIVVVQIRIGADYFGAFLFIGNPIINLFIQDTTPFIDFIKALF
jgi:hypothetical protein